MTTEVRAASEAPRIHIRAPQGLRLPDLGEIWRFRHVLEMIAVRDLKVRYKQTFLGVSWVVIQPLIAAGIFSFVFGGVANMEAPGDVPYFVFSYAGLLGWNLFSNLVNRSSNILVGSSQLIQKIYFPRVLLPLANTFGALVDFVVAAVLMVALLLIFWSLPGFLGLGVAAASLVLFMMLALGLGLASGAIAVYFRDVRYLVPVGLQFLLYASPVAYALETVPEEYLWFYQLNPLVGLLEAFRWGVLGVGEVPLTLIGYSATAAVLTFLGGVLVFKSLEAGFADVI